MNLTDDQLDCLIDTIKARRRDSAWPSFHEGEFLPDLLIEALEDLRAARRQIAIMVQQDADAAASSFCPAQEE